METLSKSGSPDPIDLLFAAHDRHEKFCDSMEEIADSLPGNVDKDKALDAARMLKTELPLHHLIEERALFPLVIKYATNDDNMVEIIDRLKEEHEVDEGLSDELVEVLESLGAGNAPDNADMVGYMLRGFFENYRRHVTWENNVVLSLARRRLPPKALGEMTIIIRRVKEEHSQENLIDF